MPIKSHQILLINLELNISLIQDKFQSSIKKLIVVEYSHSLKILDCILINHMNSP